MLTRFKAGVASVASGKNFQAASFPEVAADPSPAPASENAASMQLLKQAQDQIVHLSKIIGFASMQSLAAKAALEEAAAFYAAQSLTDSDPSSDPVAPMSAVEIVDQHGIEALLSVCQKWVDEKIDSSVTH